MEDKDSLKRVTFSSKDFVAKLLEEGKYVACDSSTPSFSNGDSVPSFYDPEKFKRGQRFFHKHIFAMFIAKLCGLISILAVPSIRHILIFTKMSGDSLTAYRRYLSTLFHMYVWYQSDFTPGSELWNSVSEVKNRHNSASKRHCSSGKSRISQMDMAITQFGFMGYVLCRPNLIGIHEATNEELEDFIHIWRVIGHTMGIEERFNICKESLSETKDICETLLQDVLTPQVQGMDQDFVDMATHLINGMWCMQPLLEANVFLTFINNLLNNNVGDNNNCKIELTKKQQFHLWFIYSTVSTMRFRILKFYHNTVMYMSMWLMVHFPFLAYYKFGKSNSHVQILQKKSITSSE